MTRLARHRAAVDRRRGDVRAAAAAAGARAASASRVAALPWVAPVLPRDAAGRRGDRAAVRARPARLGRAAPPGARRWRGRFDVAYVLPNSLKAALLPWLARHPASASAIAARARVGLLNAAAAEPERAGRRWWRSTRARGDRATRRRAARSLRCRRRALDAALAGGRAAARRLLRLRAGRRIRPGQALAGRALRRARALAARGATACPSLLLGSAEEAALCEEIAARRARRLPRLAGKTSLREAIALIARRAAWSATTRA